MSMSAHEIRLRNKKSLRHQRAKDYTLNTRKMRTEKGYAIPYSLTKLMKVWNSLVLYEKRFGVFPSIKEILKMSKLSNKDFVQDYLRFLKDVGVLEIGNRGSGSRKTSYAIVVKGNIDPIIREVYAKEGYIAILYEQGTPYEQVVFRKVRIGRFEHLKHDAKVAVASVGQCSLNEWSGYEIRDNEKWWLKTYTIKGWSGKARGYARRGMYGFEKAKENRKSEILDFITVFTAENKMSPTVREITEGIGLASTGVVQNHLNTLKEQGKIEVPEGKEARGLKIIDSHDD